MTTQHERERLIRRVNRLYHELSQDSFEHDHHARFQVQRSFWQQVGRIALTRPTAWTGDETTRSQPHHGRVVVDLACGSGFVGRVLKPYLARGDRLVAFDLSEAAQRATAHRWATSNPEELPRTLVPVAADAQRLPLTDGSVDLVAMNASLHHLPDPAQALIEIDRVLKPGGFFALGFEPNRRHFHSPVTRRVSKLATSLHWYLSPTQNRRRLRTWTAQVGPLLGVLPFTEDLPAAGAGEQRLLALINDRLVREGLIDGPLPGETLLDLVDPHARGDSHGGGLDPRALLRESLPAYTTCLIQTSDYLGETGRHFPRGRAVVDVVLRKVAPWHGSLFSWLIRKPVLPDEAAP